MILGKSVLSRYFARKGTLLRVKTQMLDKSFIRVTVFTFFFFSMLFYIIMSKQSFDKVLLARVFLDFGCATFIDDLP